MATYDMTTTQTAGAASGGFRSGVRTRFCRMETKTLPVTGDVFTLFDVEKGELIMNIAMKVVQGTDGTTPVFRIGMTGGTTDGYLGDTAVAVANEGTTTIGTSGVYLAVANAASDRQAALTAADTIDGLFTVTGTPTAHLILEFELVTLCTTLA